MHLVLLGSGLPDKPVVYHKGLRLFLNTQLLCCTALPGISRLYQEYIKSISRVYQEYIKSIFYSKCNGRDALIEGKRVVTQSYIIIGKHLICFKNQ